MNRLLWLLLAGLMPFLAVNGLSAVLEGPVTVLTHQDRRLTHDIPASLVYEDGEGDLLILRTGRHPIRVLRLPRAGHGACSLSTGPAELVGEIELEGGETSGALLGATLDGGVLYTVHSSTGKEQVLSLFDAANGFVRAGGTTLTVRLSPVRLAVAGDSLFLSGRTDGGANYVERRTLNGELVWANELSFAQALSGIAGIASAGSDYVVAGYASDMPTTAGEWVNKKLLLYRMSREDGNITDVSSRDGDVFPFCAPVLISDPGTSWVAVLYDSNVQTLEVDLRLAYFDENLVWRGEHEITTTTVELPNLMMVAVAWTRLGEGKFVAAVGGPWLNLLCFGSVDEHKVEPVLVPIPVANMDWLRLGLSPVSSGALFTADTWHSNGEIRAEVLRICDP